MAVQLNSLYEELYQSFLNTVTNNGTSRLTKARDQAFAKDQFLNQLSGILRAYSRTFSTGDSKYHYFNQQYKAGESIESIVSKIISDCPEILRINIITEDSDKIELIPFSDDETDILKKFPKNVQHLISFYLGYSVFSKVYDQVQNNTFGNEQPAVKLHSIKWTGTNKNEFVQLVYGLYKAGLINNGDGVITKTVESLAEALKVDLSDNWQSTLSASIHKVNNSYEPSVFDNLKTAYGKYTAGQLENKKKNK